MYNSALCVSTPSTRAYLSDLLLIRPYIIAELPSNLLLRRLGPNLVMPSILTIWGMVCALQGKPGDPSAASQFLYLYICRCCYYFPGTRYSACLFRSCRRTYVSRNRSLPFKFLHPEGTFLKVIYQMQIFQHIT